MTTVATLQQRGDALAEDRLQVTAVDPNLLAVRGLDSGNDPRITSFGACQVRRDNHHALRHDGAGQCDRRKRANQR